MAGQAAALSSWPTWNPGLVPLPTVQPARPARLVAPKLSVKLGSWLAASLEERWDFYFTQFKRCRTESTEERVHQLRVATRRLIAKLFLLSAVVPGPAAGKAQQILKQRLDALDELRDVHVMRLFFDGQTSAFPELILVRDALARLERRLIKPAGRKIAHLKSRKLKKWIDSMIADLTSNFKSASMQRALQAAVLRAANSAFKEVIQRRQAINPLRPRTIHRTRIAFKKFRYMVESLPPTITGFSRAQFRNLAWYQRKMGNIQDLEVIFASINEYLEQHGHNRPFLDSFCSYLRRRRTRALRTFLKSADDLLLFWPPPNPPGAGTAAPGST
jgi:CHAD domain-containing protein